MALVISRAAHVCSRMTTLRTSERENDCLTDLSRSSSSRSRHATRVGETGVGMFRAHVYAGRVIAVFLFVIVAIWARSVGGGRAGPSSSTRSYLVRDIAHRARRQGRELALHHGMVVNVLPLAEPHSPRPRDMVEDHQLPSRPSVDKHCGSIRRWCRPSARPNRRRRCGSPRSARA
jgi:hypothetical protein